MNRTSTLPQAKAASAWQSVKMPSHRRLASNQKTDVCIVGAGIAGITTAYLLTKAGKRVVLLDDGSLAGGQTTVTTAHLSSAIDDRFVEIESWHGSEGARLAAESHSAAIDLIEQIARGLQIDCDFQRLDGYLFLAADDDVGDLEKELDAAQRAGFADADLVEHLPLESIDARPAIRFPRQGRVHPLKYLAGVAKAIKAAGGKIYANSHADKIESGKDGDPAIVHVGEHTVTAGSVVVATNVPINDMFAIHTKQAPYMTYAIGARVPTGSVPDALFWDTLEAYHYVRLQPMDGYDLLIVGGEDHKSGQADDADERHGRLADWTRERFPMIEKIELTWGGQVMETMDGLAFIGRNPMDSDNIYIATGDSGMGITHGTIAGMLLSDMILGRENPWEKLYEPSRKTLRAAGEFLKENLNVAAQYADWVTPGEVDSVDSVAPGQGAILRRGLKKIAVSCDEEGKTTELSAVCPHLGCIVDWNSAEQSWDCPCHGSRFHPDGEVVNGPANRNLAPAEPE